jgi:hypothetical protein
MNDNNTIDFFKKYAVSAPADMPEETPPEADDGNYRAFGLGAQGRGETRLKFYEQSGLIALLSYAYLTEVVCTSSQFINLIYTNCVIILEGRNLTPLVDLLQDDKLRYVRCFDPVRYPEPATGEPVILSITRDGLYEPTRPGLAPVNE